MLAATRPSTAERVSAPIVSGAVVADETLDSEHVSLLGAVGEVPDTVRLTNATEEFRGKSSGSSFTGKTRLHDRDQERAEVQLALYSGLCSFVHYETSSGKARKLWRCRVAPLLSNQG